LIPPVHRFTTCRVLTGLGAAVAATALLVACGGSTGNPVASNADGSIEGQTITLYSGQHE
jgi:hypothetical protein